MPQMLTGKVDMSAIEHHATTQLHWGSAGENVSLLGQILSIDVAIEVVCEEMTKIFDLLQRLDVQCNPACGDQSTRKATGSLALRAGASRERGVFRVRVQSRPQAYDPKTDP
jgi:hypothetical protein